MSRKFDPIKVPPRWLNCPRKSNSLIVDKFVAFKVPLSVKFNPNVPAECRFNMSMLLDSVKRTYNAKIGLIIDLTNTDRFYDSESEVKQLGIRHVKIKCKGHGETPTEEDTNLFLRIVESFVRQNPLDKIGVHCTHGFNRTGFMICAYMVEKLDFSIDMAVSMFAEARTPGIYKEQYIRELFRRYADPNLEIPPVPELPTWDQEDDVAANGDYDEENDGGNVEEDSRDDGGGASSSDGIKKRPNKRQRREESKLNPKFADPMLRGVEACADPDEVARVRQATQSICNWNGAGFAGAQPVSMDQNNIRYLYQKNYMVSWKADGTRYLMYINGKDRVYMLDRDNSVFCVQNVSFPHRKNLDAHLENTLIDGEFVVDKDPVTKQDIPRFLIYDIIKFEKDDVGKMNFAVRLQCIDKEIIFARNEALRLGKISKQYEPFSIRKKGFFPLSDTKKLLSPEFEKQITHGIDGLIYQPVDEPYKGGRCDTILKWKPPSQNSVDFKLEIVVKEQYGGLPEKLGYLYVNGYDMPFSTIKITKSISQLHGKIIECKWGASNQWEFMRERVDKSYPNHVTTATAVCESIKHPITEERLIEIVKEIESRRMPPPSMPPPHPAMSR